MDLKQERSGEMYPPILDKKIDFAMNTDPIHLDMVQGDYTCGSIELVNHPEGMKFDKAWYTIKRNADDKDFVIQKKLGEGIEQQNRDDSRFIYTVALYPEDTENLEPGMYSYDIRIQINDSKFTVMRGNINILPSITGKEEIEINEEEINGDEINNA